MDKYNEILTRGVENIIPNKESLEKLLASGKKLNIYLGIDPTATRIHIGHAVPLRKIQSFVELGHNVTFLIGDFTALIGDTSDKDNERPILTYEQIQENFKTYKKQAEKILDFSKIKVVRNSEWLGKLTFTEVVKLCQHFSVGDFASRELIRKRLDGGSRVGLHEFLYPVMQGYDSFMLDTDIQVGGTDQTFNMQAGRTLLKDLKNKESFVMALGFLEGTDGRKMSKSWDNAIWLEDPANEMFGKIMSVSDNVLPNYFRLATKLSDQEVDEKIGRLKKGENPMNLKKELAFKIVSELHSNEAAKKAQEFFESTFQNRKINESEINEISLKSEPPSLVDLLVDSKLVESRTEAKRLILANAVEIDGKVVNDPKEEIHLGSTPIIVKVGKKKFAKIKSE